MNAGAAAVFRLNIRIKSILRSAVSFFAAPQRCLCCGKMSGAISVCPICRRNILEKPLPSECRCRRCGKDLVSARELCTVCRNTPVLQSVQRVYPLHEYRAWKKELLYTWKTAGDRSLSTVFAKMAVTALQQEFPGIPVVPVPSRPGKIKKQGWDQVEELVSCIEAFSDIPVFRLLVRRGFQQQKKLNRAQRLAAGEKTFAVSEKYLKRHKQKYPNGIIPESLVLIDDIMTTGATLERCAAALTEIGVQNVYALTLFIAD